MRLFHMNIPESIRKGTWQKKIEYIWEYYKIHIITIVFFAILGFSYIYSVITEPQVLLNGIFLNAVSHDSVEELKQNYIQENSVDTKKYDIVFDSGWKYSLEAVGEDALNNNYTNQIITVRTVAGDLDFVIGNCSVMELFSYGMYFCDLRELLSEEDLERYYPYFLYVDQAMIDEQHQMRDGTEKTVSDLPDCNKPENMVEPVPVLINISDSEIIKKIYPSEKEAIAIGIVSGSQNKENIIDLLTLLNN